MAKIVQSIILFFLLCQAAPGQSFSWARLEYPNSCPDESCLKNWYTDYPTADEHIAAIVTRVTNLKVKATKVKLQDASLFLTPFIYIVEPEKMVLTGKDAARLKEYLARGGFILMDDFHGDEELAVVQSTLKQIYGKNAVLVDLPVTHPLFHIFFDINEIIQTLNDTLVLCAAECEQWENGPSGKIPHVFGIFNDAGDLQVVLTYNTDLGDSAEWADVPWYPQKMSAYGMKLISNILIWVISH